MKTVSTLALLSALALLSGPASSGAAEIALGYRSLVLETNVERVTVYSDRARVTRAGKARLESGRQRVEVPDLPFGLQDASVSAALPGKHGARILSIEVETTYGKRASKEEAKALLEKYEELQEKKRRHADQLAALATEEAFLRSFSVQTAVDEKGRPQPIPLQPTAWNSTLTFVSDSLQSVLSRIRAKQAEDHELDKEIAALSVEIQKVRSYEREAVKRVVLEIEGARSEGVPVEVTYAVPGPSWRPAYDVRVKTDAGKVELVTHAVVRQATGEDWKNADLSFSTAFPEGGADLPELLAWRLGDAQQYAYAAGQGGVGTMTPGLAQAPAPPSAERSVTITASAPTRAARAPAPAERPESRPAPEPAYAYESDAEEESSPGSFGDYGPSGDYGSADDARVSTSSTSSRGDGRGYGSSGEPGGVYGGVLGGSGGGAAAGEAKDSSADKLAQLAANRPQAQIKPVTSGVWSLPAGRSYTFQNQESATFRWSGNVLYCPSPRASAGGFDFSFQPARSETVLSDGRERKFKLASLDLPAELLYEIVAPLDPKAYLRANVKNTRKQPFLAGESFVFLDDDFVGRAFLATVAPGEKMELSLGIDDDIKVDRRVEQKAETQGLFTKTERTVYTVTVGIKSFKKRAVDLLVRDQIPITWQKDDITVETMNIAPEPSDEKEVEVDPKSGILAWKMKIPPNGKQTIDIQYAVERPRDFDLVERRN